jgi:hypothetical protein
MPMSSEYLTKKTILIRPDIALSTVLTYGEIMSAIMHRILSRGNRNSGLSIS